MKDEMHETLNLPKKANSLRPFEKISTGVQKEYGPVSPQWVCLSSQSKTYGMGPKRIPLVANVP